jgi:four helix bundle protein
MRGLRPKGRTLAFSFMSDFRKLRVWHHAHELMLEAHRVASRIRGAQYLSLRSQITRAAISIPANIVEGRAQPTEAAFKRFLGYSTASTRELQYHMLAGHDLGVIPKADYESVDTKAIEVLKMLHGLIGRLTLTTAASARAEPDGAPTQ